MSVALPCLTNDTNGHVNGIPSLPALVLRALFHISLFIVNIERQHINIEVSGYCFISFFVRAFCMRLLNSIHDKIGNRSFACWFCHESRLKSPCKPTA